MNCARLFAAAAATAAMLPSLRADVKMPEIFSNYMVLQRDVKLPVWGEAAPGENITVSFNGQEKNTTADAAGKWKLALDATTAGGPFKMTVKGNNQVVIDNVMGGEVWLCSGQSNMEWSVRNSNDSDKEIPAANYPNIRLFHVQKDWKVSPLARFSQPAAWKPSTPENIPSFSAVGYFFGRELNKKLNVPVGLINSSWGGTRIEPWTPPVGFEQVSALSGIQSLLKEKDPASPIHKEQALKTAAAYKKWADDVDAAVNAAKPLPPPPTTPPNILPFSNHQEPTVLFNAMISPMVPYAIRGAIWYQGESNLGDGMMYAEKMKALIGGWRAVFNNPDMSFYFAQLAPYTYGNTDPAVGARLWEAQSWVAKNVPNTGMAVINDIGNLKDIHPRNKQDVGLRLANLALQRTYRQQDVIADFPAFKNLKIDGNKATVSFDHAQGLKTRDGKAPSHFEICGADGIFKKADAIIENETVVLSASGVDTPVAMRFAWSIIAIPNLVNAAGLPASSFRAGEIPARGNLDQLIPEAKEYKLVYALDPTKPQAINNNADIRYDVDNKTDITGQIVSIAYFMKLTRGGNDSYVFVSMDPFTLDVKKIGVPVKAVGERFQTKVKNLLVKSNVPGVANGSFPEGNIEFFDCNYAQQNAAAIPGASDATFDFGDKMDTNQSPGYGCMQVHNFTQKQTVFSFNQWPAGSNCDLGIGNSPTGNPDWTFRSNAKEYQAGTLLILVKTK